MENGNKAYSSKEEQLSIVAYWYLGKYNLHKFNSMPGYTGIRAILIQSIQCCY